MNGPIKQKIRLIQTVARWEFNRWFKWKDQFITLALSATISLILFGGQSVLGIFSERTNRVAVIGGSFIGFNESILGDVIFIHADSSAVEFQRIALEEKQIDGLLIFQNRDTAELFVRQEPSWLAGVTDQFNEIRVREILRRADLPAGFMDQLMKPVEIKVNSTRTKDARSSTGDKIAAGIFIGLMLLGVFIGLAYQFIAVTGEKQSRITEVIVSAVSPQTWIDGKIIGISLLSMVLLITYLIGTVLFVFISILFGSGWAFPVSFYHPGQVILLAVIAITGFLLWNTIFTGLAATINDPNTSSRGAIMFLPVIPTVLAAIGMKTPDSPLMIFMSLFPLTSAPAMSLRLALTSVSVWEIILSLIMTILTMLLFRKYAGLIFSLSILMYGKEPTWREMIFWLKNQKKTNY